MALSGVALLKQCEFESGTEYRNTALSAEPDASRRARLEAVVFESDMSGVEEFSADWLELIKAKMARMTLCRERIIQVLNENGDSSGFSAFQRAIVCGCARIAGHYDGYYLAYLAAVQHPDTVARIQAAPPDATLHPACYSHYTIVNPAADGGWSAVPFGTAFKAELAPVLEAFDAMLRELRELSEPTNTEHGAYVAYIEHYRACLGAEGASPEHLEEMWTELDRLWMDTKGDIQIVHDIETGYGDPLRVKATPDFSLRFLDSSTYGAENTRIAEIQGHMEDFFRARGTAIASDGLGALANTLAGIYYIPFKTGIALQFSFSGQSIPNRINVKNEKGVKIYFDPVETAARVELGKGLVAKTFADPDAVLAKYKPDAVEQLVWHVAAHEVGHAIYNLKTVEDALKAKGGAAVVTLLEEPRAELTAMFTLRLLYQKNVLDLPHLKEAVAHFALDALRYFAKFTSEPLRPYIIFQIYAWKTYFAQGYVTEGADGKLSIDDTKTLQVLEIFSNRFVAILDCEDSGDAETLLGFLDEMQQETDAVRRVVAAVNA